MSFSQDGHQTKTKKTYNRATIASSEIRCRKAWPVDTASNVNDWWSDKLMSGSNNTGVKRNQQCIKNFHDGPNQDTISVAHPQKALLQDLTNPHPGNPCSLQASSFISLTLGVDDKLRRSIHEGQYVTFASSVPHENEPNNNRLRSMEKEGQLILSNKMKKIPSTISQNGWKPSTFL